MVGIKRGRGVCVDFGDEDGGGRVDGDREMVVLMVMGDG